MEFKTNQQVIRIPKPMKTETAEQSLESEVILPDHLGDIGRILKCKAQPMILSTTINETTARVEGKIHLQLLYVDTAGEICCYTQALPFFHELTVPKGTKHANTQGKTDYCNCRAISTRKVEIRGAVSLKITLEDLEDLNVITNVQGGGVQLLTQNCKVTHQVITTEKALTLTDEIQVDSGSIHNLLRCNGVVKEYQCKPIQNKLLINGILEICCLYQDIQGRYCPLQATLPFSQVVEGEGMDETCLCTLTFLVTALELRPRTGLDGECRTLMVNCVLQTKAKVVKTLTLPLVTDGFSTKWGFSMEKYHTPLYALLEIVKQPHLCKKQIDLGREIGSVIDLWCEPSSLRVQQGQNQISLQGILTVCILSTDADQIPFYTEKAVDFEWTHTPSEQAEEWMCTPTLTVTDLSFSLVGDTTLELRAHCQIEAPLYGRLPVQPVVDIQVDSSTPAPCCPAPLVVYFAQEGESIFQIARKYSTTVGAIQEANNLTEPCAAGGALLVPACKE